MSRLGDSCNCDDCGTGWWAENGVVWKGVLCHQPWKSGRRTGGSEEEWKEEERAQTLVLIAHKLHQLPLKMVAGACEKGGQVLVKSVALSL